MAAVPASLSHVTITATDFAASLDFYDAVLGALGLDRVVELGDEEEDDAPLEAVGWGRDGAAEVWLVAGTRPTAGLHLSLRAASPHHVRAFHAAALAAGGRTHDAPRRWPIYRRGEFHAAVADAVGNLLEAVAAEQPE